MGITQQLGASSLIRPGVIDNTAARPASPFEGQVIFQKDTDQLLVWNGTAWVVPNSPAQNPDGLALITTCTVTSAGGTAATSSSGVVTIGTSNTSVTLVNAFSTTYDNYKIVISGVSFNTASGFYYIKFNNSTGSTYSYTDNAIENSSGYSYYAFGRAVSTGILMAQSPTAGVGSAVIEIVNPFLATRTTSSSQYSTTDIGSTSIGIDTNAVSQTGFIISGNFTGGKIRVYGYRNS